MLNFKNFKHFVIILTGTMLVSFLLYAFGQSIGQEFNYIWLYSGNYDKSMDKVVIVKVDNKTLDALQSTDLRVLNFTKTKFAKLIDRLEQHRSKAIGVDIVFANKSSDIGVLQTTLKKYTNVVIGAKVGMEGMEQILPLSELDGTTWGSIDTSTSESSVLSRLPPFLMYDKTPIESLSMATYRKYIGDSTSPKGIVRDGHYFLTPLRSIPVDNNGNMLIRFFNPPEKYPSISMIDVLTADSPEKKAELDTFFSGKIVLIGEYGTLIHDEQYSPVDTQVKMPGVEFHANMIDGLLQDKTLISQDSRTVWIVAIFLATFLIIAFYTSGTGVAIILLLGVFLVFIILGRRLLIGQQEGVVINLFFYLLVSGVAFIGTYIYKFLIVDRNKRYIEGAFSRYISPDIVREISKSTSALELGGSNQRIAVFFSDIANFTTLSESLGTQKIFTLLSEYLSEMTDILIANKGTLDKYIGDAIMGFFGAPYIAEKPAYLACQTALEQQSKIRELNENWEKRGFPEILFRVGIHIGDAMVGNIGSRDRFNYTAIGDTVNLASRLEGVNKEYGTLICVSELVYEETKGDFFFRELDTIRVKGKQEGVKIYELVGKKSEELVMEKYREYEKGLMLYYAEKYDEALKIFIQNRKDFTSDILATRCKKILSGEITVKDGIYEMKNK